MTLFCISFEQSGERYAGRIPAPTWEIAEEIAARCGATVDGTLELSTCDVCGTELAYGQADLGEACSRFLN